ncbi:MAG TPA: PASTA domain-containing protein [Acidobacteriaceae bacterium]|nr:PASTA domain-containing protein [Acidobacteriaceae bacterium]
MFRFAMLALLLMAVAMTSAIVTMHFAIHGAEVKVPNLRGMTLAEAGRQTAELGLRMHVESRLYSADVPEGRVANQSPAAGAVVRRGWRVWLTQSLGPLQRAIPDVVGMDQRTAAIAIRRAGLEMGAMALMPWPDAQPGAVIAQTPQADAPEVTSPVVNLLVAAETQPAPQNGLVMPDVEGQLFTTAALELARAGLKVAPVKERAAPGTGTGIVIGQNPPAGYRVDPTMTVTLTVAR